MRTLDTNTKEYKEKLDTYIYECIENPDVELSNDEKIIYFMSEFHRVANHPSNMNPYPNTVERIDDYMMGLPFNFDFSNYDKLQIVSKLHGVDKIPENKQDSVVQNFNKHIAMRILKLHEKLGGKYL